MQAAYNKRQALTQKEKPAPADSQLITGNSAAMQQVMDTVNRVAATDANILILGENGTGDRKSVV